MRNLLHEIGFSPTGPSMLRIDNQSAMSVAKHPEHHGRMKQLPKCHQCCEHSTPLMQLASTAQHQDVSVLRYRTVVQLQLWRNMLR